MWCVYETATGRLVSTASAENLLANPLPAGLASKEVSDPPAGAIWNTTTLVFDPAPARTRLGKLEFIQRFTLAERRQIFTATLPASPTQTQRDAWAFLRYLDFLDVIDLTDSAVIGGVNALQSVGLLAAGRPAEILA